MTERIEADVAIVGFGPVGAVLAGLLGRRGLKVVVLERGTDVFALPRAAHIDHTGLRTIQELGLLDELMPTLAVNGGQDFVTARDELLIRMPGSQGSVSGVPASMYFHQPDLDRRLRAAAASCADVRLGVEVTGVDGATVIAAGLEVAARWVVACDGACSLVRRSAGIAVDDWGFEERWLVVDLLLREAGTLNRDRAVCVCDPARPLYSIPMPAARHRFEFMLRDGEELPVPDLVARWLRPEDFEVERAAVYTFHGLVAREWRRDRILLAGDAAHQMPPFLGQGLCSGLRDAANLAWKLDLVLRGAPDALLDTYGRERGAHVRRIVDAAIAVGRVICTTDPEAAAERDRAFLADPAGATRRMPFALPALEPGELVLEGGGKLFPQPDRLDDVVGSRFAVFTRGPADWWEASGAYVAAPEGAVAEWLAARGADAVIVRPDRYLLWAGSDLDAATERVAPLLTCRRAA